MKQERDNNLLAEEISQLKPVLKLIVFGEGGVGKTTLIHQFITGNLFWSADTVGSGFATKNVEVEDRLFTCNASYSLRKIHYLIGLLAC